MQTVQNTSIVLSVIIPCYNQGEYLVEALSSVHACVDPVYEVIIVNDGSNDSLTISLLEELKKQGHCIVDQENQGLAHARNNGIARAVGQYILPLDADNKIRADYIPRGIEILDKNPKIGVVYGKPNWFGEVERSWELPPRFDLNRLIRGSNYIDACSVYRKSLWQSCGGYDANMPVPGWEDWDLWLTAIERGWEFHYIPEVLFDYRVREDSMATKCGLPHNRSKLIKYICTKHFNLYQDNFVQMIGERELHIGNLEIGYNKILEWGKGLEKALNYSQTESQQIRVELTQAQVELTQAKTELALTQDRNAAMESSKFWKIRILWFALKQRLKFSINTVTSIGKVFHRKGISKKPNGNPPSLTQNLEVETLLLKSPEILFISHEATRTGAPFFLLRLIPFLTRNLNIPCTILLCSGGELEPEFKKLGNTFLLSDKSNLDSTVLKILKQKNIKLVYSNTITNGIIQKHLETLNVPVLCHVHELGFSIEKFFGGKNLEYVLNTTDVFLAGSQAVYNYLTSQKNISIGSMHLAYPFVEISENHRVASAVIPPLSFPEGSIIIGACGTIGWRKGTDLFIQLAQRVAARTNKKVVFVWLGGSASNSDHQSINYDLEMAGMKDSIIFTGPVDSHLSYFTQFDIFVLPSREDPYPLVVLDAASLRIPIVCFDSAGGAPELVENDAGRSVPYLDVERMATSVLELVENEDLRKQLGQKAYTKVLERNDIESGGNHILEIVRKYL